jgi:hypothetical protein
MHAQRTFTRAQRSAAARTRTRTRLRAHTCVRIVWARQQPDINARDPSPERHCRFDIRIHLYDRRPFYFVSSFTYLGGSAPADVGGEHPTYSQVKRHCPSVKHESACCGEREVCLLDSTEADEFKGVRASTLKRLLRSPFSGSPDPSAQDFMYYRAKLGLRAVVTHGSTARDVRLEPVTRCGTYTPAVT